MFTRCVYKICFEPLRRTLRSFLSSIPHGRGEQGRTPNLMAARCLNGQNLSAAFEQELDERVPRGGTANCLDGAYWLVREEFQGPR